MPQTIDQFKAAFLLSAKGTNKKIRWDTGSKFWHTQSALGPVAEAIDRLKQKPSPKRLQAVRDAMANVSAKRKTKYKDALDGLALALDQTVVGEEETLAGPPRIKMVQTGNGLYGFRDENDVVIAENLSETRVKFVHNVMGELDRLKNDTGVAIDEMDDLLKSIIKDPKMGADSFDLAGTVWEQAIKYVKDTVIGRIGDDLKTMRSNGLVKKGAKLQGLRFTGSDFHKGGKQVLILRFDEDGEEKKVVYKPSSLKVDSLLFGDGGVAQKLGDISSYKIVAMESDDDVPKDLGYGYMEFVDKEGGPKDAGDVMGVYESIAAAMAMSYYVGLEDVHHENVMTKKKSIQVIDMEATTGTFSMPSDESMEMSGGFIDQQWDKAISGNFKTTLEKAIAKGDLDELPDDEDIEGAMVKKFRDVARSFADPKNKDDLKLLEAELGKQRTRVVPIATDAFQTGIIQFAQEKTYKIGGVDKPASLANWIDYVNEKLQKEEDAAEDNPTGSSVTFLGNAKGVTTTPLKTLRNLLVSPGVWKALRRGDVPYYVRDLGSSDVFDEDDNLIDVTGLKKVGRGIAEDMKERRKAAPDDAIKVFKAQGVRLVKQMNVNLRQLLTG